MLPRIAAGACWAVSLLCATSAVVWAADRAGAESGPVATATAKIPVTIRLPKQETVSYKGIADFDGAGAGALHMLYPAPNVAGALAAVLTHAIIAESAQSRQRRELQEAADRVLNPYRPALAGFTHKELITRALAHSRSSDVRATLDTADAPGATFVVDPAVVFYMTQDQRALVLYAVFAIRGTGAEGSDARNYAVRVVGHPQQSSDPVAFWTADSGAKLRHESALLLAEAFDLALSQARSPRANPEGRERTFRYLEGTVERMERASLVSETCERAVIRTLRGELMSIPSPARTASSSAGVCPRSP